jgi:hypothetical protein
MCLLNTLESLLIEIPLTALITEDVSNIRSKLGAVADRFPITKLQITDLLIGV